MKFSTLGIIGCSALFVALLLTGPTSAEDKLTASDENSWDIFGYSVGVDGDTAVIGAYGDDDDGEASGSAYIFQWDDAGGVWVEITKLTASDAVHNDNFGYEVAIDGDTVVVGAVWADTAGAVDSGAAYVFDRNLGGPDAWGEVAKLIASDAGFGDAFGISVYIDGDTVVAGSYSADGVVVDSGAAYVFERDAGGPDYWGEVVKLAASDGVTDAHFGVFASIDGDTAVVGADFDPAGGLERGAAYVYYRDHGGPGAWGEVTKLMADDGADGARFGISVAIDGDLVAVGAFFDDDGAIFDSGSAYVFDRNLGGADAWGQVAKLVASDGAEDDRLGIVIAIRDATVVVGAGRHDAAAVDAGAAYVFHQDFGGAGAWGEVIKLTASDAGVEDYFGNGDVALSGDHALIGAYGHDGTAGTNSGAAYVFEIPLFADGFESGTTDWWSSATP